MNNRRSGWGLLAEISSAWVTLAGSLMFLEVPWLSALLVSAVFLLHGFLGVRVLRIIIPLKNTSLLFVIGPGVVIGGAISFAIFQLFGRGWVGGIASLLISISATVREFREIDQAPDQIYNVQLLVQLTGLAALALTREFSELLPIAVAVMFVSLMTITIRFWNATCALISVLVITTVGLVTFVTRPDYWWLISDDYQILEVQTRHWTKAGPFEAWGAHDWSKYHWLPNGWVGMIGQLAHISEPFVATTRVAPYLYSIVLGASLFLACELSLPRNLKLRSEVWIAVVSIGAWLVLSLNRPDWSGTTTGAATAVIASVIALFCAMGRIKSQISERVMIYLLVFPITALTKLPAVLSTAVAVAALETSQLLKGARPRSRLLLSLVICVAVSILILFLLPILSALTDGYFQVRSKNPNLGQLSELGELGVVMIITLRNLPRVGIALLILIALIRHTQATRTYQLHETSGAFLLTLLPAGLLAIGCDLLIFGGTQVHEYFSNTLYLPATLSSLISLPVLLKDNARSLSRISMSLLVAAAFHYLIAPNLSDVWYKLQRLVGFSVLAAELGSFYLADATFWFIVVALISGILAAAVRPKLVTALLPTIIFVLVTLALMSQVPQFKAEFRAEPNQDLIARILGDDSIRAVSDWIHTNTESGDLVGTNFLADSDQNLLSDYSLAVWSDREFFVLGPAFFAKNQAQRKAVWLSTDFAQTGSEVTARQLMREGVRWFILDTNLTENRDWYGTKVVHRAGKFLVLKLAVTKST